MKLFLITPTGETGPYTPAQLNRMFAQGQISGEQLCRREDASQTQRLDEVLRHMRPTPAHAHEIPPKPLSLPARIFLAILCLGVLWLLYSFIRFRPDNVSDFSTVTGILASANEEFNGRSGHLEIRLQENPIRYCVPNDGYLDYFRREAFFAEVPVGATIELTALTSEIAKPNTFLLNSTPTVFVRGVRAGGRDYCFVEDHIAWQKKNNWAKLGLAALVSGILAPILIGIRRRQKARA